MKNFINVFFLRTSFDIYIDSLNGFKKGLILIIFGLFLIWLGRWATKDYRKEKYSPFKIIKRENTDEYFWDWLKISNYIKGYGSILLGSLLILGGILIVILEFI